MKKKKYLYLAVTDDKWEFPLCVGENCLALSKWSGRTLEAIYTAISKKRLDQVYKCRYIRVPIEEEENVYQEKGFADRNDYLNHLSIKYGVAKETVNVFAKNFGEDEDFGQLVIILRDISKTK